MDNNYEEFGIPVDWWPSIDLSILADGQGWNDSLGLSSELENPGQQLIPDSAATQGLYVS
jgi:hypothetical protein